jgi:hypothetical protein
MANDISSLLRFALLCCCVSGILETFFKLFAQLFACIVPTLFLLLRGERLKEQQYQYGESERASESDKFIFSYSPFHFSALFLSFLSFSVAAAAATVFCCFATSE